MCLQFVCKQSDENHLVHECPFLAVIFLRFFQCVMTVSWNQPQPGCWNYLYYIFIHSCTYTTLQIKTVLNNVLFSTEVHNPLHAHLLALSHIYIYILSVPSFVTYIPVYSFNKDSEDMTRLNSQHSRRFISTQRLPYDWRPDRSLDMTLSYPV